MRNSIGIKEKRQGHDVGRLVKQNRSKQTQRGQLGLKRSQNEIKQSD